MAFKPPALPTAPKEYDADYMNRMLRILTQHLNGQADSTAATSAADINNSAAKTALVAADELGFWDSVTQRLNKITWANTLVTLNGTYEVLSHKNAASGYAGLSATYQINFVNNAGTFTSLLTNASTAARTYTFPDKSITVAAVDSEAFTGTPTAPTAAVGTNTTQLATTAFVQGQIATVQGAFKNLQASSTGLNANVSITIDEIVVENSSNIYQVLRSVSLTVAGTAVGANGLDAGTIAASTWYSLWVIWNGATTAGLMSTSATAPTLPGGYTHKARIGWVRTDGTANKYPLSFKQYGRSVQYVVATGSNLAALPIMASGVQGNLNTPTWVAVAVGAYVPVTTSKISVLMRQGSNTSMLAPNSSYGQYLSTTNPPLGMVSGSAVASDIVTTMVLESTNIYIAGDNTGSLWACSGWEDNL